MPMKQKSPTVFCTAGLFRLNGVRHLTEPDTVLALADDSQDVILVQEDKLLVVHFDL